MTDESREVVLCCLLWANDGQQEGLTAYEDRVLALVAEHGGQVVQRAQSAGDDGAPHEVQLFRFDSQAGLDAYLADPRRTSLSQERDRLVKRTELFPIRLQAAGVDD